MAHCTGYGNCKQGRKHCKTAWACNVRTTNGGETVDTEGTLDEPIRPVNVIGSVSWLGIASAIVVGLAWAGYCIWLS